MSTVAGTTENNFVPANASEWRTEKIILKDFCARNLNNVMIGFEAVNEYGNNLYIDSIAIVGFNSVSTNAILKSASQPLPVICAGNSFTPQVNFSNAGMDTINNLKIKYVLDNGPDTITTNWTGKLGKCDSITITLPQGNAAVGAHALTVFTSEPNGLSTSLLLMIR